MSTTFADLGVPAPIVQALAADGITAPFPIQAATMADALAGRDVLGRGRTGSGKTVAFAVPTVAALAKSRRPRTPGRPRALLLVPTRELAVQVQATITPLATAMGLRTMTIFGGVGQGPQVSALKRGVDVVVATPGRLEDLIAQGHCRLDQVEVTVLDEADHLSDLGFLPAVRRLLTATPADGQRLLFSATLDQAVDQVVKRFLHQPVTHSVDSAASPVPAMTHHLLQVTADGKAGVVQRLVGGQGRTVAFTRTKHRAKKLAKELTAAGIPAVDLHGNLSQAARQRNLAAFGSGETRVLVATDIAARGIHVDDVALVVHVDPPTEHKAYLHRSGRTARAGNEGVVVTVSTRDEHRDVTQMMRKAGIKPRLADVTVAHPVLEELAGPQAAFVEPAPVVAAAPSGGGGGRGRGSRGGVRGGASPSSNGAAGSASSRGRRGGSRSGSGSASVYSTSTGSRGGAPRGGGQSRPGQRSGAAPAGSTGGAAAFSSSRSRRSR
ncbi:DEAD/DEAH box helicase [Lapillicoccus jejuensis]|uniref:Superfamily II DNA/RNA helicase n=1 Tax=Lapillicoccus jejuensis TaxID=402171 RepID=A0A542DZF7_9MICO|nr:DEAD/DEAH box helicase [Lapillicoccus jejuensis]TQJ08436.1 superfamily II DNA/RNA helicase [Lapillicoccus jejuensis]